jgi:hypothetical protein
LHRWASLRELSIIGTSAGDVTGGPSVCVRLE